MWPSSPPSPKPPHAHGSCPSLPCWSPVTHKTTPQGTGEVITKQAQTWPTAHTPLVGLGKPILSPSGQDGPPLSLALPALLGPGKLQDLLRRALDSGSPGAVSTLSKINNRPSPRSVSQMQLATSEITGVVIASDSHLFRFAQQSMHGRQNNDPHSPKKSMS